MPTEPFPFEFCPECGSDHIGAVERVYAVRRIESFDDEGNVVEWGESRIDDESETLVDKAGRVCMNCLSCANEWFSDTIKVTCSTVERPGRVYGE